MKVLVVAHRLELGGTQVNAIELAAEVRDRHGIEVVLAAAPGPAVALAQQRELTYLPLPDADHHPGRARSQLLDRIGTRERPDVVHVWDWPQCFDAYAGLHLRQRRPLLCSVMSMDVPRFVPRHLPTTFGTPELARRAAATRSGRVYLLEPPVDLAANSADAVDGSALRRAWGVRDDDLAVVTVSRLVSWYKLEGLERALDVTDRLAHRRRMKLVVVGDGTAREQLQARADAVNARHDRQVVLLAGPMIDPRPAYAASDVMLGMGGSALRTMAFGKPLVVLGERGFSRVLDETSAAMFVDEGYYGLGDGRPDDLEGQLDRLLADPAERARLGRLGLDGVRARYSLTGAADSLAQWYAELAGTTVPLARASYEAARTAAIVGGRRTAAQVAGLRARRHRGRTDLPTEEPGNPTSTISTEEQQ